MTTSVPVFCCPKCGAVGDVQFVHGSTHADVDEAVEDLARANHDYENEQSATMKQLYQRMRLNNCQDRLFDVRRRLRGPWLDCSCPRCGVRWRERPLDTAAVAAESTPIYDAMSRA